MESQTRHDRKKVARFAIHTLAPMIRGSGTLHLAEGLAPSYKELEVRGLVLILAEPVLLDPTRRDLKSTLDIWPGNGRKVLGISWDPLEISSFSPGNWIETLVDMAYETSGQKDER